MYPLKEILISILLVRSVKLNCPLKSLKIVLFKKMLKLVKIALLVILLLCKGVLLVIIISLKIH